MVGQQGRQKPRGRGTGVSPKASRPSTFAQKTREKEKKITKNGKNTSGRSRGRGSSRVRRGFPRRLNPTPPMPSAPTPARFPGADMSNPLETPAVEARPEHNHGSPTPDKLQAEGLAADLDFYGTNEGLTLFDEKEETQHNAGTEHAGSHSLSLSDGKQAPVQVEEDDPKALLTDSRNKIMERMRRKLKEQEDYISELEDSVLELREKLLEVQNSK